ncbi:spermidine synthase [Nitrincola iocasae]|uniref:Spermidine synthase n=1 Tax=Nitrincola iocasae TaxID=2614693 RepID=A0A5J6LCK4_9GAMM|nr:spermidine synthase [Nitrincola iocasae]QEW05951.1 spermidine synthase [Nitrincola iocasae]
MSLQGTEIHRCYDEYGVILVLDDGNKRYLSFGTDDEQSCYLKSQPAQPQADYIRAMLLVLLFVTPSRIISMGLGGGSLNTCLHHQFSGLKQDVVELRHQVIQTAYKYFQLPRSKHITLHNMEAKTFLDTEPTRPADIIFSDIYDENGVDAQQHEPGYLHECYERLKPDGWLVMNCWKEHRGDSILKELALLFADIRTCTTQDGNWIIYACKTKNELINNQLKQSAKQLSQQLGFSVSSYLNRLG